MLLLRLRVRSTEGRSSPRKQVGGEVGRIVDQQAEQVGAGDHADDILPPNHRNEPLAIFDDQFLDVSQGPAFRQGGDLGGHVIGHRQAAEFVKDGFFQHHAGDHAQQADGLAPVFLALVGAHHRQDGHVIAGHQPVGLIDAHIRGDGDHRGAHQFAGNGLGADMAMEQADKLFLGLGNGQVADGGRGGRGMAAAAELPDNRADIDLGNAAAGNQVGPLAHADQGKEDIDVFHDHQPLDDQREIIDIVGHGQFADHHGHPANDIGVCLLPQLTDQADLFGGEFAGDKLGDDVEIGAVGEQPGGGGQIFGTGGGVEKTAGILVDAQRHQGGLVSGGHDALFLKDAGEKSGGRAKGFCRFQGAAQVAGSVGVMIVEMNENVWVAETFGQLADPFRLPGVNHDQALDFGQVDMFDLFKFVDVAKFLGQVIADTFFLRARKDQFGFGVQFFRGDHGRQAVEVGADMGGDDIHGPDYTPKPLSVKKTASLPGRCACVRCDRSLLRGLGVRGGRCLWQNWCNCIDIVVEYLACPPLVGHWASE